MKVIVTGGAGFIGSQLVDRLLNEKNNVIVIDNLSTGTLKNLEQSIDRIEFINYDLSKTISKTFLKKLAGNIDIIFHLAALPRIGRSIDSPIETHAANVTGTLNTLQLARILQAKKFIYASSSSVYGNHDRKDLPLVEEASKNPANPYATQKLIGEEYCQVYSKVFNVNTYCMRLFNVYGPRMSIKGAYKLVFGNWMNQIKLGQKLTIYGDGEQTRDFTYIDDVIKAFIMAMKDRNKSGNFIYNVCSGEETSINKLAKLFNQKVEYIKNPRPQEEKFKVGDFKKIHSHLQWLPKVPLKKGIKKLMKHHD